MAATFAMMAKVKGLNVKFVMGSVPQRNGKDGEHAWCEIKSGKTTYVYDPNFAYTYRNNPRQQWIQIQIRCQGNLQI